MKKENIFTFIQSAQTPPSKRDIVAALNIKGSDERIVLKKILKELLDEGQIIKQGGGYTVPDGLPGVAVLEVTEIDSDGDVIAKAVNLKAMPDKMPHIVIVPDGKHGHTLKTGDRALCRLKRTGQTTYDAKVIKKLDAQGGRMIGMVRLYKGHKAVFIPTDKKARDEFEISVHELNGAEDTDLAIGEVQPHQGMGKKAVRIIEIIGKRGDPKAISLISLYESGLREDWPDGALKDTKGMKVPELGKRTDLRHIPLITIDGADARDFDDAVFAEPLEGGGFHLMVAIADVSYYVRGGTELYREAQRRGNSTYFPDRVVPMLPEILSNDLCSLRPNEDRACMAVHLWIDAQGYLEKYKFVRGLMRSHARMTYEQVQAIRDGITTDERLSAKDLESLYAAYGVLFKARETRGALDLDLPERQIIIDDNGNMTGVKRRARLDSHKLIEEFMILANVAAAMALEAAKAPCVYRVHEPPSLEKLDSAREFIDSFGLSLPKGQVPKPKQLNALLHKAAELPYSHLISQVILRAQSQAVYSPENKGHYGLALDKYAHFTSPIRRYADLLVHRALIRAYKLGEGGLQEEQETHLEQICDHICQTERTSMEAERNAVERFTAAYLSEHIGAVFTGRISGVTRFGLFVTLDESGADGLVPIRSLPGNDYYVHDEKAHALIGRQTGNVFRLGAPVTVMLAEADGLTGSTLLELSGHAGGADIPGAALPRVPRKDSFRRGKTFKGREGKSGDNHPKNRGKSNNSDKKRTTPKHKRKNKR